MDNAVTFRLLLVEDDPSRARELRAWLPEWVHLVWVATATGAIELIRRDTSDLFGAVLLDHDLGSGIATAARSSQSGLDVAEGLVARGWFEVPVMIHSTDRINAPRMARRLDAAGFWVQWLPFHDMTRDALVAWLEEARLLWEDLRRA